MLDKSPRGQEQRAVLDDLVDEAQRQCPHDHDCLFAWVPAHLFWSEDFGIAIDEIGAGENLQNGLVGEVIDKAAVEQAVTALAAC